MIARCFLLPAILGGLFAASWSPAGDLPRAPPPRVKKSTAEFLIGKWKLVSQDGNPFPKSLEATIEFAEGGKVILRVDKSRNGPRLPHSGKYWLKGKIIHIETEANAEEPSRNWAMEIESITEDELVTVAGEDKQRTVNSRVKK